MDIADKVYRGVIDDETDETPIFMLCQLTSTAGAGDADRLTYILDVVLTLPGEFLRKS